MGEDKVCGSMLTWHKECFKTLRGSKFTKDMRIENLIQHRRRKRYIYIAIWFQADIVTAGCYQDIVCGSMLT